MVKTTTPVLKVRNTGIVICDDQEARNKRITPQLAQCKGKGKAPCSATGIERLTPSNVLQILKDRNGGVIICEDKGYGKPPCQAPEKENQAPNGSVISNVAAAQRARREREKMSKSSLPSKASLAQQARRQREQNYSAGNEIIASKASVAQPNRRQQEKQRDALTNLSTNNATEPNDVPVMRCCISKSHGRIANDKPSTTSRENNMAQINRQPLSDITLFHPNSDELGIRSKCPVTITPNAKENTRNHTDNMNVSRKGKEKESERHSLQDSLVERRNTGVVICEGGRKDDNHASRVIHNETPRCSGKREQRQWQAASANGQASAECITAKRLKLTRLLGNEPAPRTPDVEIHYYPQRTPITTTDTTRHPRISRETELDTIPIPRALEEEFSSTIPDHAFASQEPLLGNLYIQPEISIPPNNSHSTTAPPTNHPTSSHEFAPAVDFVNQGPVVNSERHSLGPMNVGCSFCEAMHWQDEKLVNSSVSNPKFGKCCLQGKVRLPLLQTPPPEIKELYDGDDARSNSFRSHIRQYNASHAFTSLGFQSDKRIIAGSGPRPFTIHGELRHRTGSLIPGPEREPAYAQLYIYDPDYAFTIRCRNNDNLRPEIIRVIQDTLLRCNTFTQKFRQAYDILCQPGIAAQNLPAYLHYTSRTDRRRYNLPTSDEVAVILPGDESGPSGLRDIILHLRENNGLMQISECHPAYLPLHYVLLFPHGELGWDPTLRQWNVNGGCPSNVRLTQMQYYSYRLFQRNTEYSTILRAGRLFQQFLVDAWAATEQNRLRFFRLNQGRLRAELYKDLMDFSVADGARPDQVGRPMILPSSHPGSPRHMFEIFQDSMAITRYNHHPDIFLTMTANPSWPEVSASLFPHQSSVDRPDLAVRVFELKRKEVMRRVQTIFGKEVGHVFTIEFQKRGLPHMHLLQFLDGPDKIKTCEQVDRFVSAEIPDPVADPLLFQTVMKCMIHGPCGVRNPNAACMENGKCTKGYPKEFSETTTMDKNGYFIYRRTNNGKKYECRGQDVDNRDVVPYNPDLSREFDCHINVEVCAGNRCVKYIHKYIYKGHDRTTMILGGDEIQQYLDGRYIGPSEAAWRILGHPMHEELPSVMRLHLHLPGMHQVNFNPNESIEEIGERIRSQVSTLTAFFAYYASHEDAPKITYQEFPQYYVWKDTFWAPRKRGFSIGRMYFASPNSGERFYLRLLLIHVAGPTSFESLRTVNGVVHPTFMSACVASGLVEDDSEWVQCLEEAAIMQTGYQLRRLFSTILTQCSPSHPDVLWNRFAEHICDDLAHRIRTSYAIQDPTPAQVQDYGLFLLNQLLLQSGKSLVDFPPMPQPTGSWSSVVVNRLISEHIQLQGAAQQEDVDLRVNRLNHAQLAAYEKITTSVVENKGFTFFLNGGAGTGKTFLYNTIALKLRSVGHVVITVASSGIAALLLLGGRTAHSTFCIPLNVHESSICSFTKQSIHAELFRKATLIIWDEVPMQHKHCVEAVDRSLRDARDIDLPFGGITVVFGGDFRQILPVVTRGVRQQVVSATLRRSNIWNGINVLTLNVNMRMDSAAPSTLNFVNFLEQIGSNPEEVITIPSTIHVCRTVGDLLNKVYPDLGDITLMTPKFLTERTILSARNDEVNAINKIALQVFHGERMTYLAADKLSRDDESDRTITSRYPDEYMHSLDLPGLPPFKLELKVGCPIMLLRNLAPNDGLCNGTRLVVVRCASRIIEAKILTGDKAGNYVFIPRISLTPSSGELPFHMTRRQFPVRLAFSMTINKAQGQSVKFVGIDLRNPVFSHGQLYVALSRCTSANRISCLLSEENESNKTTNIVYPEILLH